MGQEEDRVSMSVCFLSYTDHLCLSNQLGREEADELVGNPFAERSPGVDQTEGAEAP
jgi:hypothetical protein